MSVAAVDIGTNSMRLLITDGSRLERRWVEVTGLGQGVDAAANFDREAVDRTLETLARYGEIMTEHGVTRRKAIATSATREAGNRDYFLDRAEAVLGVRPSVISGAEEAHLAFRGATARLGEADRFVVSDIGGGSTEFVTSTHAASVDIGSVRLTERFLPVRPPSSQQLGAARDHLAQLFGPIGPLAGRDLVGVAGTWTSLAAIALKLPEYTGEAVHHARLSDGDIKTSVEHLSRLTVAETAAIPALDPKRAPVIMAGALIAEMVMDVVSAGTVLISESDTLDAVAADLLALR